MHAACFKRSLEVFVDTSSLFKRIEQFEMENLYLSISTCAAHLPLLC